MFGTPWRSSKSNFFGMERTFVVFRVSVEHGDWKDKHLDFMPINAAFRDRFLARPFPLSPPAKERSERESRPLRPTAGCRPHALETSVRRGKPGFQTSPRRG